MKTPMQELLEKVQEYRDAETSPIVVSRLNSVCVDILGMLQKEKEVMCEFADEFAIECINFHHEKTMSQEQFFNLTFNTKEK
jgi:hypothetical protein